MEDADPFADYPNYLPPSELAGGTHEMRQLLDEPRGLEQESRERTSDEEKCPSANFYLHYARSVSAARIQQQYTRNTFASIQHA